MKETKNFPGLGEVIREEDAFGNAKFIIHSLFAPEPYVVGTTKAIAFAKEYLDLDKALYGDRGVPLPLATRWEKLAKIKARAEAFR